MKSNRGQSLIEMIVVIGIVVLLATGIVVGTTVSLSGVQSSGLRSSAVQYAQQGLELARAKRDAGWTAFAAMGTGDPAPVYCVGSDGDFGTATSNCTAVNISPQFIRSITLQLVDTGDPAETKVTVDSVVKWGDSSNPDNKVEFKTELTQWK